MITIQIIGDDVGKVLGHCKIKPDELGVDDGKSKTHHFGSGESKISLRPTIDKKGIVVTCEHQLLREILLYKKEGEKEKSMQAAAK